MSNKLVKKKSAFLPEKGNIFGHNRLDVPKHYMDEAEERGWEVRWISAKQLKENSGVHKNEWMVYKFKSKPQAENFDPNEFAFGKDPEGIVRIGDCVLAVRPKEIGDAHRNVLAKKRALKKGTKKNKISEFKEEMKQFGQGKITVDDSEDK
jgi:hypothetical protein